MRAHLLHDPGPAHARPLALSTLDDPMPGRDEVLIEVSACGVCRTDLHVIEGDLPLPARPIVPGHEVVGRVIGAGSGVADLAPGTRVGVSWVHRLCGRCGPCRDGRENLCASPVFTGYHVHGGYAERLVAPAAFVHRLPDTLDDLHAAPLLCAGIIGYRALRRSDVQPGRRVALWGFGGSAHIALQVARAWDCEVFVVTRSEAARERARALGAAWAGAPGDPLPVAVEHAVSFAPSGAVIPPALEALAPGGVLAIAGIHVDAIGPLDYARHLFHEKELRSVTANTREDARELLALAAGGAIETDIEVVPFTEAGDALERLATGRLSAQAAVLRVG